MTSARRELPSCYVLSIELDAPGGGDRRETFAYGETAHLMSVLRQELEGALLGGVDHAVDAIAVRGQTMRVAIVQAGTLVDAVDVRAFLRVCTPRGDSLPIDGLEAEWREGDPAPVAMHEGAEVSLVAIELDELGLLSALPALAPPLLRHGDVLTSVAPAAKRAELVDLSRALGRNVSYGYADAAGVYVSRERFHDPDPPSLDDIDAWMTQHPPSALAIAITQGIAARADRDAAARWVRKVDREGLPVEKIEEVLREAFDAGEGAPPLRTTRKRVEIDPEVLGDSPRWEAITRELEALPVEGAAHVEERLRVFCHDTSDHGAAVIAFMLRQKLARGRGPAHSALMLKQAMQRSEETALPGIVAAADAPSDETNRVLPLIRESARRLAMREGELSEVDALLLRVVPTTFDAARFDRAARLLADAGDFEGAAAVAALADRIVSDPADVCAVAAERARLLMRSRRPEDARAVAEHAIRYWDAHAWMRAPEPSADCRFWRAAAMAATGDASELDAIIARSEHYRALAERERVRDAAPEVIAPPEEPSGMRAGQRVAHAKFGPGTIERIEGAGDAAKIAVRFDGGESKVLLARFLTLVGG